MGSEMNQDDMAKAVNAEVQRQLGQMLIDQIAAQIAAQAMQARIAELEAQVKSHDR